MAKNQDKTICCRVDNNTLKLLNAIADHKKIKLSAYLRSVIQSALTSELMQLDIISTNQVTNALAEESKKLSQSTADLNK